MLRRALQRHTLLQSMTPSSSMAVVCAVRPVSKVFAGTDKEFVSLVSSGMTIVDFYTSWCGPCSRIAPEYEALSDSHPSIRFLRVNVEDSEELSALHDIRSIPTFLGFHDGKQVARVEGAQVDELKQMLKKLSEQLVEDETNLADESDNR